jgi:hypothetical protein
MKILRLVRAAFLFLLLALYGVACSSGSADTVVLISVAGGGPSISLLRVTTTLNGMSAIGSEEFAGNTTKFGLELPPGSSGSLTVLVDAYDGMGCIVARGRLDGQLGGDSRVELSVTLTPLAARMCNGQSQPTLSVTLAGSGSGAVTSDPTGINCGTQCSAEFQSGAQVTLTATAAPSSAFAGWSGACTGMSPTCTISVSGVQSATATFNTGTVTPPPATKFCTDKNWCWDNPLPQGNLLRRLFGMCWRRVKTTVEGCEDRRA